jgi:hypothetical protein
VTNHPEILNAGLDLSMAWGPDWLQPIQSRLAALYPALGEAELDAYEAACREAMSWGHAQVPDAWHAAGHDQAEANRLFEQAARERYPWISDKNVSHLFSQGTYYAWKNGDIAV